MAVRSVRSFAAFPIVLAAVAALSLVACERADEPPAGEAPAADVAPPATEPAATDTTDDIDATRVVDRAPAVDAAPDFDAKAFAGTFSAEGANLQLAADGTYALTVHAESADADLTSTGTWTVEADGSELLLDPDAKDDADQRFTIASDDELVAAEGGRVLRRDDA